MAEGETKDTEQDKAQEGSGGLMKKIFSRKSGVGETEETEPAEGTAHLPATVLTVEYLDQSEGMDAALRQMEQRIERMEETLAKMEQTQSQLIAAFNQQAKDIGRVVESVGRRIDKLYGRVTGGDISHHGSGAAGAAESAPEPELQSVADSAAAIGIEVPEEPAHQNAWRIARVLAADLEAYHEEDVKEGVLYGTFYKLLREPLEKARDTYEQRVDDEIVENYDYFSKAVDELIARKRMELEQEGAI